MSEYIETTHGVIRPQIIAVGTAVPSNAFSQLEVLDAFGIDDRRIRSLYLNGGINRRYLSLPPKILGQRPNAETQSDLLQKHVSVGVRIGQKSIEACLENAGAKLGDISYLCCVSSTGFIIPGFSALLIKELNLSRFCARLDVVGMGCNAGLNAMAATADWARNHPGRLAILVCIEVCSALYVDDNSIGTAVVNSLFGDGAAAVAITANPVGVRQGPSLLQFSSQLIPEAIDAMRVNWSANHEKFSFVLDQQVPYTVGANVEGALKRLLGAGGLIRSDVTHWIVHSGGRKVIDAVRVNLGLTRNDVRHTLGILRDYGNLSSASFLFSYERLLREDIAASEEYGVMITMGPGSTIEMALLQW